MSTHIRLTDLTDKALNLLKAQGLSASTLGGYTKKYEFLKKYFARGRNIDAPRFPQTYCRIIERTAPYTIAKSKKSRRNYCFTQSAMELKLLCRQIMCKDL